MPDLIRHLPSAETNPLLWEIAGPSFRENGTAMTIKAKKKGTSLGFLFMFLWPFQPRNSL
jgi:hypothetical protein